MSSQTDQPTPKPLTVEEITETAVGQWTYKVEGPHREDINTFVHRLAADLRASRAETAALRESLAEAEKQRDTYEGGLQNLLAVIHRDGGQHSEYVGIAAATAEAHDIVTNERASRDALAAELAEARRVVERLNTAAAANAEANRLMKPNGANEKDQEVLRLVSESLTVRDNIISELLAARDSGKASGGGGEDGR